MAELEGLRVLVAGGTEVIRRGLSTMVAGLPMVREVESSAVDVVIVLPPLFGDELTELAGLSAKFLVVLPDRDAGPPDIPVDGLLLESELTTASLGDALSRMSVGEVPMPARFARELLGRLQDHRPSRGGRRSLLTPRESRTLSLLADGLSNKQIARRLGVSEHAAKRTVAGVLAKLNCANRALAVAVALREGMLDPPEVNRHDR